MYIVGLISKRQERELTRRGWEVEDPPPSLVGPKTRKRLRMVWVDSDMFETMCGPGWEASPPCGGEAGSSSLCGYHARGGASDKDCRE